MHLLYIKQYRIAASEAGRKENSNTQKHIYKIHIKPHTQTGTYGTHTNAYILTHR